MYCLPLIHSSDERPTCPSRLGSAPKLSFRDARSDIWGVGAVAYFSLSGTPPIQGDSQIAVMRALVNSDSIQHLSDRLPSIPRGLGDLVAACLSRDAENRVQSAFILLRRIENLERRCSLSTHSHFRLAWGRLRLRLFLPIVIVMLLRSRAHAQVRSEVGGSLGAAARPFACDISCKGKVTPSLEGDVLLALFPLVRAGAYVFYNPIVAYGSSEREAHVLTAGLFGKVEPPIGTTLTATFRVGAGYGAYASFGEGNGLLDIPLFIGLSHKLSRRAKLTFELGAHVLRMMPLRTVFRGQGDALSPFVLQVGVLASP